ncbi:MAG: hypothetical protein HYR55_02900, partial [Acidobacteria bacterium]|nr:hypothetical protein [Acidobacteriota bacterium]
RCDNRYFQILKKNVGLPRPGDPLTVSAWLDGSIHLLYKGRELKYKELPERPRQCRGTIASSAAVTQEKIFSPARSSLAPVGLWPSRPSGQPRRERATRKRMPAVPRGRRLTGPAQVFHSGANATATGSVLAQALAKLPVAVGAAFTTPDGYKRLRQRGPEEADNEKP